MTKPADLVTEFLQASLALRDRAASEREIVAQRELAQAKTAHRRAIMALGAALAALTLDE